MVCHGLPFQLCGELGELGACWHAMDGLSADSRPWRLHAKIMELDQLLVSTQVSQSQYHELFGGEMMAWSRKSKAAEPLRKRQQVRIFLSTYNRRSQSLGIVPLQHFSMIFSILFPANL